MLFMLGCGASFKGKAEPAMVLLGTVSFLEGSIKMLASDLFRKIKIIFDVDIFTLLCLMKQSVSRPTVTLTSVS